MQEGYKTKGLGDLRTYRKWPGKYFPVAAKLVQDPPEWGTVLREENDKGVLVETGNQPQQVSRPTFEMAKIICEVGGIKRTVEGHVMFQEMAGCLPKNFLNFDSPDCVYSGEIVLEATTPQRTFSIVVTYEPGEGSPTAYKTSWHLVGYFPDTTPEPVYELKAGTRILHFELHGAGKIHSQKQNGQQTYTHFGGWKVWMVKGDELKVFLQNGDRDTFVQVLEKLAATKIGREALEPLFQAAENHKITSAKGQKTSLSTPVHFSYTLKVEP